VALSPTVDIHPSPSLQRATVVFFTFQEDYTQEMSNIWYLKKPEAKVCFLHTIVNSGEVFPFDIKYDATSGKTKEQNPVRDPLQMKRPRSRKLQYK
jgi:hypothetical protein